MMIISDRLTALRKSEGLTQNDVACNIGISRTTYVRYENGDIQPPADMIVRLANFFLVSIDYLLGETDDPTPPNTPPPVYDKEALELMEEMHKRPEMKILFKTSKRATRADIEAVNELMRHMIGESEDS